MISVTVLSSLLCLKARVGFFSLNFLYICWRFLYLSVNKSSALFGYPWLSQEYHEPVQAPHSPSLGESLSREDWWKAWDSFQVENRAYSCWFLQTAQTISFICTRQGENFCDTAKRRYLWTWESGGFSLLSTVHSAGVKLWQPLACQDYHPEVTVGTVELALKVVVEVHRATDCRKKEKTKCLRSLWITTNHNVDQM